ncbi:eukaryotic translation initiation factor 4 gamma 1-like isoform 1-T1 [Aulostomus maculatus]
MEGALRLLLFIGEDPYRLDLEQLKGRVALLRKYLSDGEKQLQAVYALQELMEEMHHPKMLLLTIFDVLFVEDVIKHRVFLRWEARKDADQRDSKAEALRSVRLFFSWLDKEDPQEFLPARRPGPFWQRGRNH